MKERSGHSKYGESEIGVKVNWNARDRQIDKLTLI